MNCASCEIFNQDYNYSYIKCLTFVWDLITIFGMQITHEERRDIGNLLD